MPEFVIQPEKSCVLIIDMTNAFLGGGGPVMIPDGLKIIPRLNKLLDVSRQKRLKVIFTTHVYHLDGCDLGLHPAFHPVMGEGQLLREGTKDIEFYRDIQPQKGDIILNKPRFSAFIGTELDLILRSNGIDTLILGGVVTNICCESTTRDARMLDYKVIFLSDGTAARDVPDMGWGPIPASDVQRYTLTMMACHFAQVLSVEQVIQRLEII